jgi:hypothetical protein
MPLVSAQFGFMSSRRRPGRKAEKGAEVLVESTDPIGWHPPRFTEVIFRPTPKFIASWCPDKVGFEVTVGGTPNTPPGLDFSTGNRSSLARFMAIQFLCPNGHRIHCPDDRAGMAAKCPKCGVKFRIPTQEDLNAADSAQLAVGQATGSGVGLPAGAGVTAGAALSDEEIEFLCPNNHLLHGPTALQGQPGECPTCGSKFRIPSWNDLSDEEQPAEPPASAGSGLNSLSLDATEKPAGADAASASGVPLAAASQGHSAASVFTRLWMEKRRGAQIEIRCRDGQTLTPTSFAPRMSQGYLGVFAVKQNDGNFTLTAIPWDTIAEVTVRNVKRLPEEMGG